MLELSALKQHWLTVVLTRLSGSCMFYFANTVTLLCNLNIGNFLLHPLMFGGERKIWEQCYILLPELSKCQALL
jgi:hypothetical protein